MIKTVCYLEGHLDEEGNYLITSDESYEQYTQTKKASEIQEREMQEKEQAEQKLRGNSFRRSAGSHQRRGSLLRRNSKLQ